MTYLQILLCTQIAHSMKILLRIFVWIDYIFSAKEDRFFISSNHFRLPSCREYRTRSSTDHVGIVTAAAPNAGVVQDQQAAQNEMNERVQRILNVFEVSQHETLVLGAFGCGVFRNDPVQVATIFRQHSQSNQFKNSFKRIIFAILDPKMCDSFQKVFSRTIEFNPTTSTNNPSQHVNKLGKQNIKIILMTNKIK